MENKEKEIVVEDDAMIEGARVGMYTYCADCPDRYFNCEFLCHDKGTQPHYF